ncbi:MAG: glycosyltransferase [Parcubacteria group bacterium Gr01-1014_19]|nr:MAG: glycosyltransferase [Parcubacteria group bacterium Gr01-1014_19]
MNRLLDILGSSLGLLITAPFYPLISWAIQVESQGPAVIRLDRVSKGKKIRVFKFRSMYDGAHEMKPVLKVLNERTDGPFFKMAKDPRVTKVGRLLRKFRIDELPQLINVLKGDMALVGPRPHEPGEVIHYPGEYKHLIMAKAGLTGLSQISGASGLPFLKELELDSHYVKNKSLALDAKILAKTAAIMFSDPTAV